jgi:hypothetical protein
MMADVAELPRGGVADVMQDNADIYDYGHSGA